MSEATPAASFAASIIVPTYNEEGNVAELISRVSTALAGVHAELIIVDDSNDETPVIARALGETAAIDVTVIHRDVAEGGLGGAVVAGIRAARRGTAARAAPARRRRTAAAARRGRCSWQRC